MKLRFRESRLSLDLLQTHERRVEVQQPGSPSVLMPTLRVIEPSPTTGVLSGKASIGETSYVELLSLSYKEHGYYSSEEVDFGDELLFLTQANSRISQRKKYRGYVPAMVSPIAEIVATESISFVLLNWYSIKLGMSSNIFF